MATYEDRFRTINSDLTVNGNLSTNGDISTTGAGDKVSHRGPIVNLHTNKSTATTIDVSGVTTIRLNGGSTSTVTDFTGGVAGQLIRIFKVTASHTITVQNNATIKTKSGGNIIQASIGPVGTFVHDGTYWMEV